MHEQHIVIHISSRWYTETAFSPPASPQVQGAGAIWCTGAKTLPSTRGSGSVWTGAPVDLQGTVIPRQCHGDLNGVSDSKELQIRSKRNMTSKKG